jgi:linear primary-alkylsulfatase
MEIGMPMKRLTLPLLLAASLAGCEKAAESTSTQTERKAVESRAKVDSTHYHPQGKAPSQYTRDIQAKHRQMLPFADERDIQENTKGFMAAPDYRQIKNDKGGIAWDMGKYDFLLEGKDFDSIHPSLQRQAVLNMAYGLYEVLPDKIYQVRGYDLANITFVKGDKGWIIFDPLTAEETARAALKFANQQLGERPVSAVVYSHSHIDHFAGVKGVTSVEDVNSGKTKIIAPVGFMDHAVAENVYAGNAMIRRANYQYGQILPASAFAHVDSSIGKAAASGNPTLIPPSVVIEDDIVELTVDGVRMVFQNTPGTEAPSEMNTYFPDWKAFWAAENITATIHNIYTLRGALVRDALAWSKEINRALYLFGGEAEVMFASHSWPRWGNERIQEVMRAQRDMYAHLNNQVLHLANKGVTINEMHNEYKVPESLQQQWAVRFYHGSEFHNSRAVINRYLGYWDGNPATLTPLSPADSAPLYVEMMGGSENIINKGTELFNQGKYLLAMEILNKLVYAEPSNEKAKQTLADVFEQLGYQYESPSVRNSYLAAAKELRDGVKPAATTKSAGPDLIQAMTTEMFLEFIGIRMDSEKAGDLSFVAYLETPDNGEKFVIELSNSTLTVIEGFKPEKSDLSITINRKDLETVMMGINSLQTLIESGKAKTEGDLNLLVELGKRMVEFDPFFEIMPGTKGAEDGKDGIDSEEVLQLEVHAIKGE